MDLVPGGFGGALVVVWGWVGLGGGVCDWGSIVCWGGGGSGSGCLVFAGGGVAVSGVVGLGILLCGIFLVLLGWAVMGTHKVFPKTAEFGGCSPQNLMRDMQHRARGPGPASVTPPLSGAQHIQVREGGGNAIMSGCTALHAAPAIPRPSSAPLWPCSSLRW